MRPRSGMQAPEVLRAYVHLRGRIPNKSLGPLLLASAPLPWKGRVSTDCVISDGFCHRLAEVRRARLAAEVRRLRSLVQDLLDRLQHGRACLGTAQMLQHHGARPDLA